MQQYGRGAPPGRHSRRGRQSAPLQNSPAYSRPARRGVQAKKSAGAAGAKIVLRAKMCYTILVYAAGTAKRGGGAMRILGVDPGYAIVGFGVVSYHGAEFVPLEYGAITTEAGTRFAARLNAIYDDLDFLCNRFRPDCIAIERLYFNSNQKTAIDVAQARGVIVLCAEKHGIPMFEYTPLQVKMAVVGYGRAEKRQVMDMTRRILHLAQIPKPDDAADALALAICHGHSATGVQVQQREIRTGDTV